MRDGPTYIVSDAHLGANTADREASFRAFLQRAAEDAGTLVLNGDIFDFWYEYGSVVPRGHTRLLGTLADIVDSGVSVHLLGGNHDWWFGSFFTDEIGVTVHQDPVILELSGLRCLVAHGDGLGKGDLGYRMLRMVFRGRFTQWAFRWLHPDWGAAVARRVSLTETRRGPPSEEDIGRSRFLEHWAMDTLAADPTLDLVTVGHTHVPAQARTDRGQWYFNTGDWIHFRSFLKLVEGQDPVLMQWQDELPPTPLALPTPS